MPDLVDLITPEIEVVLTTPLSEDLLEKAESLIEETKTLHRQHKEIKRRWYELGKEISYSVSGNIFIN